MTCEETRPLLEAYSDSELDLAHTVQIEAHLRTCPICRAQVDAQTLRHSVLTSALRYTAPAELTAKLRHAISKEAQSNHARPAPRLSFYFPAWQLGLAAAAMVLAVAGGFGWGSAHREAKQQIADARDSHVRALLAAHLTDVTSTDQHTVKPWFAGKLDFSPPVIDLAAGGFPLIGGRLERVAGHSAAALVYQRRQHIINLLVWPLAEGGLSPQHTSLDGIQVESWTHGSFAFTATSDLTPKELSEFSNELKKQIPE